MNVEVKYDKYCCERTMLVAPEICVIAKSNFKTGALKSATPVATSVVVFEKETPTSVTDRGPKNIKKYVAHVTVPPTTVNLTMLAPSDSVKAPPDKENTSQFDNATDTIPVAPRPNNAAPAVEMEQPVAVRKTDAVAPTTAQPALVRLTPSSVTAAVPVAMASTMLPFEDGSLPVCVKAVPEPVTVTSSVPEGEPAKMFRVAPVSTVPLPTKIVALVQTPRNATLLPPVEVTEVLELRRISADDKAPSEIVSAAVSSVEPERLRRVLPVTFPATLIPDPPDAVMLDETTDRSSVNTCAANATES